MEVLPIFASFLVTEKLNIDHKKIADWCFNHPDLRNDIVLTLSEPELEELYTAVNDKLTKLHNFLGFKQTTSQKLYEGWVNCDYLERTSVPHTHPRAQYICIYYPYVDGKVGYLELSNPNKALEFVFPQTAYENIIENYNVFNSNLWQIPPQTDLLVIIPAWLQHYVRESEQGSTRLSIALNSQIIASK